MLYTDDESIKGDFTIDARGSSALLVRDVQNQAFLNLLAAGANPIYGKYLDTQKLFEKALQAQHIDPAEVFKPEEELTQIREKEKAAENAPPQDPPQVMAAKIRASTEQGKGAAEQRLAAVELNAKLEMQREEHRQRMDELMVQREIEMMRIASAHNITLEQVKGQLAGIAIAERTKRDLFNAEKSLALVTGHGI
jgi:hypothetical protein